MVARRALGTHLFRLSLALSWLAATRHSGWSFLAGVNVFLAAFAFNHDVLHGALRLPRRVNEVLLTLLSLLMGWSGSSVRKLHLLHHRDPLSPGDVEGHGGTLSLWAALRAGPADAARYRLAALDGPRPVLESLVATGLLLAALLSRTTLGAAWASSTVLMHLTASVWASHLPHRRPELLLAGARRLLWTGSAVIASLVFHDVHHRHPKLPCASLHEHAPPGNGSPACATAYGLVP